MTLLTQCDDLKGRDRIDDLLGGRDDMGIVWDIDVESGVHFHIREIRGRIFHHRDFVAKFSSITDRCLQRVAAVSAFLTAGSSGQEG